MATGNWKMKSSAFAGRVGVSQLLNRNTYISCISQLRRVDTGIDSQQKIIAPRLLYGNQWGYMCPSETPEGGPCGLVKQLSLSAYITTQCEQVKVLKIVSKSLCEDGQWLVFHNGAPIGRSKDSQLVGKLRNARRVRTISSDVCVAVEDKHIHIWTDSGRVSRPVFVVKDGAVVITPEQVNDLKDGRLHWKDLFTLGVIENLSVYEEEVAFIALHPKDVTTDHSHCELDPSLILGTLASTIPYPDHNQSPRNVYQSGKLPFFCTSPNLRLTPFLFFIFSDGQAGHGNIRLQLCETFRYKRTRYGLSTKTISDDQGGQSPLWR